MRCRICGAKLSKENADICLNCYKDYKESEELKNDTNERLVVRRKYKISYILLKWAEAIFILSITILGMIAIHKPLEALICAIISLIIVILILAISKKIARGTKVVFYNTKVIYTVSNFFYSTQKVIKYTDIKNINFFQTYRQKKMKFGDICVYVNSNVPGAAFFKGFQIKDVENISETLEKIYEIVGITEK